MGYACLSTLDVDDTFKYMNVISKKHDLEEKDDSTIIIKIKGKKVGEFKQHDHKIEINGNNVLKKELELISQDILTKDDIKKLKVDNLAVEFFKCATTKQEFEDIKKSLKLFCKTKCLSQNDIVNKMSEKELTCLFIQNGTENLKYLENKGLDVRGKKFVLDKIADEKVEPIKVDKYVIGNYYVDRNIVMIYFDVFTATKEVFDEVVSAIKSVKPKTIDNSDFSYKILIDTLIQSSKDKLQNLKSDLKDIESRQKNIVSDLDDILRRRKNVSESIKYCENSVNMDVETVSKELTKVSKLKFVKDVYVKDGSIFVKYVPTFMPVNNFNRGDGDRGKRDIYIGEITIELNTYFKIHNTHPIKNGHPHPHANTHGQPCFGSGEGYELIKQLQTQNKLTDLFWYLWQWIKTIKDDGAYVKSYNFYDDRLEQGLPVWEGTTRIVANEKDRLKTLEQVKLEDVKKQVDIEKPKL